MIVVRLPFGFIPSVASVCLGLKGRVFVPHALCHALVHLPLDASDSASRGDGWHMVLRGFHMATLFSVANPLLTLFCPFE